ncbi:inositol 2-dehydrogenase [Vibrio quintilis]|uniref:Inositol 2-dehydrogenase n=1 Tax=Vibrio quintilis TaxID=1117707 RepID=A0A1M7YXF7_9VIBR|nr:inositol 2-dehydrogenase [Vibrio quintilis]SHO57265.1 Inositol 2-dehydrogenase [Vibrio quintilis]
MYNIALFGAGRIGQVVHSVNIDAHPETNLYSVIDPFGENAQKIADKFDCKIQTVEEAMQDPNIHGVLIASATDTHAELIELAAKAGKAIFCEKPVHLDMDRVKQCLQVVEAEKVPLFIGFNRRYDPQFKAVKERLSLGMIGKAESLLIISRDPSPPPVEYIKVSGGLFRDMTIHDLDMARFIMGEEPVSVYASGSTLVDENIGKAGDIDTAYIVMRFPSGAMATISNSRRSGYGYDQRLELHGEKGVLAAKNLHEDAVEMWTDEGCQYAKPEFFFLQRYEAAYQAEWKHFVEVLSGKSQPAVTGYDGQQALYLADKALESLKTGQEVKLD